MLQARLGRLGGWLCTGTYEHDEVAGRRGVKAPEDVGMSVALH
jgi:hypothetical protein